MTKIRIGSRGSKLALWQAHYTQDLLKKNGIDSEITIIKTRGDQIQHLSFDKIEGKGFFTKEIEDALLAEEIDLAVHSMKDMPTASPEGLSISAVSYRDLPEDWLIIRNESYDESLPMTLAKNAKVGTSSARRKAQLLHFRKDLTFDDIRGNVPTRLQKLKDGQADAIVLAAAGLNRLEIDLSDFKVFKFLPKEFIPAPAQGVLAYQTRKADKGTRRIIQCLHDSDVVKATNVERTVLKLMDGGCQMPLGVYCEIDNEKNYHVYAAFAEAWNGEVKKVNLSSGTHFELAQNIYNLLKV